jgi:small-conductance mechanosensitive channel
MPSRGLGTVLRLGLWLVILALVGRQLGRARDRLLPTGLLPTTVLLLQQALRLAAIFLGLLLLAALLPEALLPIVPIAMLGAAAAMGLSLWTLLPDLWAGLVLAVERRIIPGQWVHSDQVAGEVSQLGIRATVLIDRDGGRIVVPNRALLHTPLVADEVHWPPVEITVPVPPELSPEAVRQLLMEAVWLSPFLAPDQEPALVQEGFTPPTWRVRARIVEAHWADEFEGALRERVRELLERRAAQQAD